MTPPGPKRKPASKRKTRVIGVRVTDAEYRRIEGLARGQHVTVAAWARAQVMRGAADEIVADRGNTDTIRREQAETLAETKALVEEVRVLYQRAIEKPKGKT